MAFAEVANVTGDQHTSVATRPQVHRFTARSYHEARDPGTFICPGCGVEPLLVAWSRGAGDVNDLWLLAGCVCPQSIECV